VVGEWSARVEAVLGVGLVISLGKAVVQLGTGPQLLLGRDV
jgi:hypothetical protein